MSDGSLASQVELWIRDTLRGLAALADRNVDICPGSTSPSPVELAKEMLSGKSSPMVWILFEGDLPRSLQEGQQAYEPTYAIYIAVRNERPGKARTGDGATLGTNGLRDLLRDALHDKSPDLSASGYYTDITEFRGVRVIWQQPDVFVMRAEVVVREAPAS